MPFKYSIWVRDLLLQFKAKIEQKIVKQIICSTLPMNIFTGFISN